MCCKYDCDYLEELSYAHHLVLTCKKFTSSGTITHFEKKTIFLFFTRNEISNVCFSLFSYFKNWLFRSDSYQFEELYFSHPLCCNQKNNYVLWRDHVFKKINFFYPYRDYKRWFFTFSYFRHLFFKSIFTNLKNLDCAYFARK